MKLNQSKVEGMSISPWNSRAKAQVMSELTTIVPPQLVAILDRPPLCVGEDRTLYDQLRDMLMDEIKPATVTEFLLAYDIAKAEWELLRLHGFKAGMINAHMVPALKRCDGIDDVDTLRDLLRKAFNGESEARDKLQKRLGRCGVTLSELAATAYEKNIAAQMQTDHMINAALQRREAAYAELERRRRNGGTPKRIASPVIEGELSPTDQNTNALDIVVPADAASVAPTNDHADHA